MECYFPLMDFNNHFPFISAPWCFNGHAHTIMCSLLFESPELHSQQISIPTPDNDFLEIDYLGSPENCGVVTLFHGLEGNSRRYYITQLARQLNRDGFHTIAFNFRSCSGRMNRQKKFYHSGETDDLETLFDWISNKFPNLPVFAAGFSLGASSILNYLKKHGTHHPVYAAAAISTPFDLKKGSLNLNSGFNKVYNRSFLQSLIDKLEQKRTNYPDLPEFNGSTLYEFDDTVTAPLHGFMDADDYYSNCSSAFFIDQIKTSTLVIHSQEDPLCPFRWTPVDQIQSNPVIEACYPRRGGHVGFWSMPPGWLNRVVSQYFTQQLP